MQTDFAPRLLYEQAMKQAGLRVTQARRDIFDVLLATTHPLPIQAVANRLEGTVHFVSVYRSIDAMHRAGIVKQVPQGFKNLFELSDLFKPHHHHATCESCGKSVEISEPRLEDLMKQLSLESGLRPTKHHFELFGICQSCIRSDRNLLKRPTHRTII